MSLLGFSRSKNRSKLQPALALFWFLLAVFTVNIHPTFVLYSVLAISWVLGEAMFLGKRPAGSKSPFWLMAAPVLGSFLTPLGLKATLHPIYYAKNSLYSKTISEGLWYFSLRRWEIACLVLAVGVVLAMAYRNRERRPEALCLFVLGLLVARNPRLIPYFDFCALPLLVEAIPPMLLTGLATLASILGLFIFLPTLREVKASSWPIERTIPWSSYPRDAAAVIAEHNLHGPVFNAYQWGGWLDWYAPDLGVFIDGRNEAAFSESVYRDHLRLYLANPDWEQILERRGVRLVLLDGKSTALLDALAQSKRWTLAYRDAIAFLFVPRADFPDKVNWVPRQPTSDWLSYRGQQWLGLNKQVEAGRCFEASLQANPYDLEAWLGLGFVAAQQNQLEVAAGYWLRVLELDPQNPQALQNLVVVYRRLGQPQRVQEYADRYRRVMKP